MEQAQLGSNIAGYRHILCATDFSPRCKLAAAHAAALAALLGARLTLLHVIDHFPEDRSNRVIAPEDQDPVAYRREAAQQAMTELLAGLDGGDIAWQIRFTARAAEYEILDFVEQNAIDLVVIANRAHLGVAGMLGSTATRLVHAAPCDVLVVRSGDAVA